MQDWRHIDKYGNITKCVEDYVFLKLAEHEKVRRIGFYNTNGNFIKGAENTLSSKKHKFKKLNGYGVNYHVVQHLEDGAKVVFITDEGCFYIRKEDILSDEIKQFSKQGFELQYIIPVYKMTPVLIQKINFKTRRDL